MSTKTLAFEKNATQAVEKLNEYDRIEYIVAEGRFYVRYCVKTIDGYSCTVWNEINHK